MRPDWDAYFFRIAEDVAARATCDRKHVGAVLVRDHTILATGYNGAPRGLPHCDDVGHKLVNFNGRDSCVATTHAEANSVAQAARMGVRVEGATLYTTASTCWDCAKLVINAGVVAVLAKELYQSRYGKSDDVGELFELAGVAYKMHKGE